MSNEVKKLKAEIRGLKEDLAYVREVSDSVSRMLVAVVWAQEQKGGARRLHLSQAELDAVPDDIWFDIDITNLSVTFTIRDREDYFKMKEEDR